MKLEEKPSFQIAHFVHYLLGILCVDQIVIKNQGQWSKGIGGGRQRKRQLYFINTSHIIHAYQQTCLATRIVMVGQITS